MEIAVNAVKQMLRVYEHQFRTAELVRDGDIKVVQGQKDRVTISPKAREMFLARQKEGASLPPPSASVRNAEQIPAQMTDVGSAG